MFWQRILKRIKNKNNRITPYLIEVLLIIFSILIAIQADRYNQSRKNEVKLESYVQSIHQDLQDENRANQMNLLDCQRDIHCIKQFLRLCRFNQDDSLDLALSSLMEVFVRGVFRPFPPTTFDIMVANGDIALVKDLELRKYLASTFSFRENYLQKDLLEFDKETKEVALAMSKYFNLVCMRASPSLHTCLTNKEGLIKGEHNELFLFLRTAQLRAFHLETAIQYFKSTITELETQYELKIPKEQSTEE